MPEFRFKRFSVLNEQSAMKVNTDGVLLGAAVSLGVPASDYLRAVVPAPEGFPVVDVALQPARSEGSPEPYPCAGGPLRCLDIGTGTGTIALMLAQRLSDLGQPFRIDAIDIDVPSAEEAGANFSRSPWADSLAVFRTPLQTFEPTGPYDLIVSNPPYYDDSLRNPDPRKADARHTESLSYADVFAFASLHLAPGGRVALVLPSEAERPLLRSARSSGLPPARLLRISTASGKPPRRIIAEFLKSESPLPLREQSRTIMQEGRYTGEYTALLQDFYINM